MNSKDTIITDYVPKELFLALEKLLDERFSRLQAVVEKNLAEHKAMAAKTEGRIDTLTERIEHAIDTLSVAISNNNQRLDDFKNDIEHKQSASATKIGVFTALFIGAVQVIVSVVLHFWF